MEGKATDSTADANDYSAGFEAAQKGEALDLGLPGTAPTETTPTATQTTEPKGTVASEKKEPTAEDRLASIEKALLDTKQFGTEKATEAAELRRQNTALLEMLNSRTEAAADPEPTRFDKMREDFPDLAPIIDELQAKDEALSMANSQLEHVVSSTSAMTAKQSNEAYFKNHIVPEIAKTVPEYPAIVEEFARLGSESEFSKWISAQSPAVQQAGLYSNDAGDIALAVNLFKQSKGTAPTVPPAKINPLTVAARQAIPSSTGQETQTGGIPADDAPAEVWQKYYDTHPDAPPPA